MPFKQALVYVHSLGLDTEDSWKDLVANKQLPVNIPASPDKARFFCLCRLCLALPASIILIYFLNCFYCVGFRRIRLFIVYCFVFCVGVFVQITNTVTNGVQTAEWCSNCRMVFKLQNGVQTAEGRNEKIQKGLI